MISVIVLHVLANAIVYLAIGGLVTGLIAPESETEIQWLWVLLWPIFLCMFVGSMLRNLL